LSYERVLPREMNSATNVVHHTRPGARGQNLAAQARRMRHPE